MWRAKALRQTKQAHQKQRNERDQTGQHGRSKGWTGGQGRCGVDVCEGDVGRVEAVVWRDFFAVLRFGEFNVDALQHRRELAV